MPLLPKKNSLDYNPDATILASKKLTAIALERMKNPLEDPDQSTLSTLEAQKQLDDSFNRLEEMAGEYSNLVLRLGSLLGKNQAKSLLDIEQQRDWAQIQRQRQRGSGLRRLARKLHGKGLSGGSLTEEELAAMFPYDSSRDNTSFVALNNYVERLNADRQRFRRFYQDNDQNSQATPAASASVNFADIYPDDESASSIPSSASFALGGDGGDFDPYIVSEYDRLADVKGAGVNFNSLIFPLIQLTRRMNILINSRIKPAIPSLNDTQISNLNNIYKMVRTSYNDVVFPVSRIARKSGREDPRLDPRFPRRAVDLEEAIISQNQFGDEILSVWDIERKNLLLNLTIIINSWKQNTPDGQQMAFSDDIERSFQNTANRLGKKAELVEAQGAPPSENFDYQRDVADLESIGAVGAGRKRRGRPRKTGEMTLIGNGRNFYGEQINNSRDLPTIFSGAMRNCPTKYLL